MTEKRTGHLSLRFLIFFIIFYTWCHFFDIGSNSEILIFFSFRIKLTLKPFFFFFINLIIFLYRIFIVVWLSSNIRSWIIRTSWVMHIVNFTIIVIIMLILVDWIRGDWTLSDRILNTSRTPSTLSVIASSKGTHSN